MASILEKVNRVALIIGGLEYERHDVDESSIHIKESLLRLGFFVKEIFLNKSGFEYEIKKYSPDICFIIDPFYIDSEEINNKKYKNVSDVRKTLSRMNIKYTGCDSNASAICKDKIKSKKYFKSLGISTPIHFIVPIKPSKVWLLNVVNALKFPLILKPIFEGAGVGVHLCHNFNELVDKIQKIRKKFNPIMIEEFICGIETTVGVMGRNINVKTLTPVEIELLSSPIYDYETKKKDHEVLRYVPARLSKSQLERLKKYASNIHRNIGCSGITRVDFKVNASEIFCLEINSSPSLLYDEHISRSAYDQGILYDFLILEILFDGLLISDKLK